MQGQICGCLGAAIVLFVAFPAASQSQTAWNATQPRVIPRSLATDPAPTPEQAGDTYEVRKEYQAAIAAYEKVEPPTADVWNKIGVAYQMLLDSKDAAHSYERALKMDPGNFPALNNFATLEDLLDNFPTAEKLCRKALKLQPRSAQVLKNLGTTLLLQHEYGGGADAYAQAMAIDPHVFDNASRYVSHISAPSREFGSTDYFQARICARSGQAGCAVLHLRKALDEGFATVKTVAGESDFDRIRDNPQFVELLGEQK